MKYTVETGLFTNDKFAKTQMEMLIRKGYSARIDKVKIERKKHLAVRIGLYSTTEEANKTADMVLKNERLRARIIEAETI